jgi:hypothetical protein
VRGYCGRTQSEFDGRNMRPRATLRKGHVRAPSGSGGFGIGKQPIGFVLDNGVALAGPGLRGWAVEHRDAATGQARGTKASRPIATRSGRSQFGQWPVSV